MPAPRDGHLQRCSRGRSFRRLRQARHQSAAEIGRALRIPELDVRDYESGQHVADESVQRLSCYHLKLLKEGEHHGH